MKRTRIEITRYRRRVTVIEGNAPVESAAVDDWTNDLVLEVSAIAAAAVVINQGSATEPENDSRWRRLLSGLGSRLRLRKAPK